MPNWCDNKLVVTGTAEELRKFRARLNKRSQGAYWKEAQPQTTPTDQVLTALTSAEPDVLAFGEFVPIPIEVQKADYSPKYGASGNPRDQLCGYNWCIEHWGSKWDAADAEISETARRIVITFNTAWSPPTPVVEAMAQQHPALRFVLDYAEGGAGYAGVLTLENGLEVSHQERKYQGNRGG